MNVLDSAMQSLASQLQTHVATPIVYSREGASVPVTATRGSTMYEGSDSDGVIHRTTARDYLVPTDVFPFTDPPRDGDLIQDGSETYVVASMVGAQPYRFSDQYKRIYRIHTKRK
jgi:hypothetical protein